MKEDKKIGVGFGVMILKDRKILLGKRNIDPKKADSVFKVSDCWTMPGGKLDYGEGFEQGATREVLEETGIEIKKPKVICLNTDINKHAHFITIGFLVTEFNGVEKVMEPNEITEWKWFKSSELPKNIYFPSKKILENFKAKKFYIKKIEND